MKYFTIKELCYSDTAKRKKIDNRPTEAVKKNLTNLVDNLLDPAREAYGAPITVSSGYRCTKLNFIVGGVSTSNHLFGYAADLVCKDLNKLYDIISKMDFDECFMEYSGRSKWLHVAYISPTSNKHELGTIRK